MIVAGKSGGARDVVRPQGEKAGPRRGGAGAGGGGGAGREERIGMEREGGAGRLRKRIP